VYDTGSEYEDVFKTIGIDGFHGSIRTGPNRISKGAGVQTSAPFFIFTT
jgi:hypothetical protein